MTSHLRGLHVVDLFILCQINKHVSMNVGVQIRKTTSLQSDEKCPGLVGMLQISEETDWNEPAIVWQLSPVTTTRHLIEEYWLVSKRL